MSWVTSIYYDWTTLTSRGDVLILYGVPMKGDDEGNRCDMCSFDIDPCTYFASPVDVVDCDGFVCSDFDAYCTNLHISDPAPSMEAITDL